MLSGTTGLSDARGRDGLYSLHFGFVARGFASTAGRRWRVGEAERAARYIVREDGLEDGERGWWSNIAADRTELVAFFRALEAVERHDRKNANVYCSEIVALPTELTAAGRRQAVAQICAFFAARGLPHVAALHLPDEAGDQRNFHCHIIYSLRPAERHDAYDWSFGLAKANDINTPAGILARREHVVQDINAALHAAGIEKRYTALSNKARRMAVAQEKLGQKSVWVSRRIAAAEARAALLDKARSIASHVRSSLVDANSTLTHLWTEVGRIRTERDRHAVIGRDALTKAVDKAAQLESLRERAESILVRQRSVLAARLAATEATIQQYRVRLLTHTHARQAAIRRMGDLTIRIQRASRRIELRHNLETIEHRSTRCADRLNKGAILLRARLRNCLSEVRVAEPLSRKQAERSTAATVDALTRRRKLLIASTAQVLRHQDLLTKRKLMEDAQFDRDQRAVTLIQRHRIALVRTKAIADAVQGLGSLSDQIATSHSIVVKRLREIDVIIVDRGTALNDAIAAAKANGARLLTELSKGPQPEKTAADLETPASKTKTTSPIDDRPSTGRTAADAGSSKKADRHDVLRRMVRERKPPKNMPMFPPPPTERSAPDPELLRQRARDMDMLRAEVRRREKRIRAALRERTLRRLRRLDIEITRMPNGDYAVAANILTPDEIRVLMDPSFHTETQRFLGRIAVLQRRASTPPMPSTPAPSVARQTPAADEEYEQMLRQQQLLAGRLGKHGGK